MKRTGFLPILSYPRHRDRVLSIGVVLGFIHHDE